MKIIIVGSGWYGCHLAYTLNDEYDILILEKNDEIFQGSSYYNQNRLHQGYHYPRNENTRNLCYKNFYRFINLYNELIDENEENYYVISNNSLIDYGTYLKIFYDYNYEIIENKNFSNIDGNIIKVNEKIINSKKSKLFFEEKLKNKVNFRFNYEVKKIIKNKKNKIVINDEYECDFLFDCTYNNLNLNKSKKYIYEKSLSLIYKRKNYDKFSLTVMDGNFFSIYPHFIDDNIYTLTSVKETPLIKTTNLKKLNLEFDINSKIKKFENEVLKIYNNFLEDFEYKNYFISYKCKLKSNSSSRELNIEQNDNIISVNCGKITGIFDFTDFISNTIKLKIKTKINVLLI